MNMLVGIFDIGAIIQVNEKYLVESGVIFKVHGICEKFRYVERV
jgi:hypothetical protein